MELEPKLGILKCVNLRSAWEKESTHFTPWLFRSENLKMLGESIELDLVCIETEAKVGPFRADILCKDTVTDSFVLIENQLEFTDHIHLGQLMTYAAGLDSVNIIWVAQKLNEEHRAALDWLNRITIEGYHFFGVEIELWQIGESLPAPKFNIVSKPNDWQDAVKTGKQAVQSEKVSIYYNLWSNLIDYLKLRFSDLKYPNPGGQTWISFPMADIHANVSYAPSKKTLYIYLLFKGDNRPKWREFVKVYCDLPDGFQFIDRGENSYIQWSTFFHHEDKSTHNATFQTVGELLIALRGSIHKCNENFKQQISS